MSGALCVVAEMATHGAFLDRRVGILAEESLHRLDRTLLESLLRKVLALCRPALLLGFGFGLRLAAGWLGGGTGHGGHSPLPVVLA